MERLTDLKNVYIQSFKNTVDTIKHTPYLVLIVLAASIVNALAQSILLKMGVTFSRFGSILVPIVQALIVSFVFYQLETGINYKSLDFTDIRSGMGRYFYNIYLIRFIFYLFRLFAGNLFNISLMGISVYILVFIILNPIGEAIYLKGTDRFYTIRYAWDFFKENWYIWLIHVIIFLVYTANVYNINIGLPFDMYARNGTAIFRNPVLAVFMILDGIYLIFRGNMFKILMDSNIRKRKYMGMFK